MSYRYIWGKFPNLQTIEPFINLSLRVSIYLRKAGFDLCIRETSRRGLRERLRHIQRCRCRDCSTFWSTFRSSCEIHLDSQLPFSLSTLFPILLLRRGIPGMNLHCFKRKFFHSPPPLTPIQLPSSMETHLWYVKPCEVRSESLLSQYWDILSPCEKDTVLRMRGDELRKSALLSRALVRTTIARYQMNLQVSPQSLKFRKNSFGKPEVDWGFSDDCQPPPVHFNISHTSSLVACGVTINSQIGIDVEEKHRSIKHSILSFVKRYFSEHEVQFLAAITDPEVQRQEFIKLWTLKEAYVKALGRGFSGAPFKTFSVRFNDITGEAVHRLKDLKSEASEIAVDSFDDPSNHTSHWQFLLLELAGSHYAAICIEKHSATAGKRDTPVKLTVWKTIPFSEDEQVSGTDNVKTIHGLE